MAKDPASGSSLPNVPIEANAWNAAARRDEAAVRVDTGPIPLTSEEAQTRREAGMQNFRGMVGTVTYGQKRRAELDSALEKWENNPSAGGLTPKKHAAQVAELQNHPDFHKVVQINPDAHKKHLDTALELWKTRQANPDTPVFGPSALPGAGKFKPNPYAKFVDHIAQHGAEGLSPEQHAAEMEKLNTAVSGLRTYLKYGPSAQKEVVSVDPDSGKELRARVTEEYLDPDVLKTTSGVEAEGLRMATRVSRSAMGPMRVQKKGGPPGETKNPRHPRAARPKVVALWAGRSSNIAGRAETEATPPSEDQTPTHLRSPLSFDELMLHAGTAEKASLFHPTDEQGAEKLRSHISDLSRKSLASGAHKKSGFGFSGGWAIGEIELPWHVGNMSSNLEVLSDSYARAGHAMRSAAAIWSSKDDTYTEAQRSAAKKAYDNILSAGHRAPRFEEDSGVERLVAPCNHKDLNPRTGRYDLECRSPSATAEGECLIHGIPDDHMRELARKHDFLKFESVDDAQAHIQRHTADLNDISQGIDNLTAHLGRLRRLRDQDPTSMVTITHPDGSTGRTTAADAHDMMSGHLENLKAVAGTKQRLIQGAKDWVSVQNLRGPSGERIVSEPESEAPIPKAYWEKEASAWTDTVSGRSFVPPNTRILGRRTRTISYADVKPSAEIASDIEKQTGASPSTVTAKVVTEQSEPVVTSRPAKVTSRRSAAFMVGSTTMDNLPAESLTKGSPYNPVRRAQDIVESEQKPVVGPTPGYEEPEVEYPAGPYADSRGPSTGRTVGDVLEALRQANLRPPTATPWKNGEVEPPPFVPSPSRPSEDIEGHVADAMAHDDLAIGRLDTSRMDYYKSLPADHPERASVWGSMSQAERYYSLPRAGREEMARRAFTKQHKINQTLTSIAPQTAARLGRSTESSGADVTPRRKMAFNEAALQRENERIAEIKAASPGSLMLNTGNFPNDPNVWNAEETIDIKRHPEFGRKIPFYVKDPDNPEGERIPEWHLDIPAVLKKPGNEKYLAEWKEFHGREWSSTIRPGTPKVLATGTEPSKKKSYKNKTSKTADVATEARRRSYVG